MVKITIPSDKQNDKQAKHLRIHLSWLFHKLHIMEVDIIYWTFLLHCQKNERNDASNCIKAEPAISIGTMALSMNDFIDSFPKSQDFKYLGELHFDKPPSYDILLGFGLRIYSAQNKCSNQTNF